MADATSDTDLGERFDVVFIGDVVEHVDNAVRLLQFAARHLAPEGVVLVATPNPFSRKFFRQLARDGAMVTNLDHVAWITPSMALELGRRARLQLQRYHLVKRVHGNALMRFARSVARRFTPMELAFPDYLYELCRTQGFVEPQLNLPRGEAIVALHDERIQAAGEPMQPPVRDDLWTWIEAEHCLNVQLSQKQEARRLDVADDAIVASARAIERLEQQRSDAIERIDEAILVALDAVEQQPGAWQHSETPGAIIDRLSILAVIIDRMERGSSRKDMSAEYRADCAERRARLALRRDELAACLNTLLARAAHGQAIWRVMPRHELSVDTPLHRCRDGASS